MAGEIGSYKPAHWALGGLPRADGGDLEHVHVAQSLFHDIGPASELGIPSVWINRLGEPEDEGPTRTLDSLAGLADTLDELARA